jgi:hypothetical protein
MLLTQVFGSFYLFLSGFTPSQKLLTSEWEARSCLCGCVVQIDSFHGWLDAAQGLHQRSR